MTGHALMCAAAVIDGRATDAAHPQLSDGTLGYLAGEWDVVREIADHRSGVAGSFRGRASFRQRAGSVPSDSASLDGRVLELTEEGQLRFGAHHGPAARSLLYYGCSDGSAEVRFADGREFYHLDLRTGGCHAVHPCRTDRYAVTVTWLSPDSFTEVWQVTGPAKDYDLTSVYTRSGCPS